MSENKVPEKSTFDWVTERSRCSLPMVFSTLRAQIEQDVKTRNGLRPELAPYEFSMVENGDGFKVVLQAKGLRKTIAFSLMDHAILIRDDTGEPIFEVTLTFSDDGKCKLNARQQEWEYWQIRRMALEELMFRSN